MKIEDHLKAFDEHKEIIFRWALDVRGIENSQRTVGLHASRAIAELLSAYLHQKQKIDEGFQINHRWFKSKKIVDKLPEFENKDDVVDKMMELENICEYLSYGSPKPVEKIEEALKLFKELEGMITVD